MKFHVAILGVLCANALVRDENNEELKATTTSTDATWQEIPANEKGSRRGNRMRLEDLKSKRDSFFDSIAKITPPRLSDGASLISKFSSAFDEITVGVQGIQAKNGAEFLYLPMNTDIQAACFESYENTDLEASDLISCCDAAAEGGYNSFRFDGGGCKGFKAWLSPIYTKCVGDWFVSPGLFVAKKRLSNFTPRAPTFKTSSSLKLSRIFVDVTNFVEDCPYSKTLKVTTYSKTEAIKLDFLFLGEYHTNFYLPELCDDSASPDKRTVTISILDSDGSELALVEEVPSSEHKGRHLLSNGVCVLYSGSPLRTFAEAQALCDGADSFLPFGDGFFPFADLLKELAGLEVQVSDFWTDASLYLPDVWIWYTPSLRIDVSLLNVQSLTNSFVSVAVMANVTDGLLYLRNGVKELHTVCIDAPYFMFSDL